jgi:hypothetical protein
MVQQPQQKDYVARTCSLGGNRRAADAHREQVLCTGKASKLSKCYPCVGGTNVLAYWQKSTFLLVQKYKY